MKKKRKTKIMGTCRMCHRVDVIFVKNKEICSDCLTELYKKMRNK